MSSPGRMPDAGVVNIQVNGVTCRLEAGLHDTLLTVLRDGLQLTAAKRGCNQGVCGACTVGIDGESMRSCLTLAHDCEGSEIRTLEGWGAEPRMRALQAAFAQTGAFQCGFCTPGMLVSAHALLQKNAQPDEADIRTALSGNLCRCTGYVKIIQAVRSAASTLQREDPWR